MDDIGFSPTDPLYVGAQRAYESVYAVSVELHDLRRAPGTVGRSSGENRHRPGEMAWSI